MAGGLELADLWGPFQPNHSDYCFDGFMCPASEAEGEADLKEHLVSVFAVVELVSQCEDTHFLSSNAIDLYNSLLMNYCTA